jgi:hypothetical protein
MSSIQTLLHRPTAPGVALLVSSALRYPVLIVLAIIFIFVLLPVALDAIGAPAAGHA